MPRWVSRSKVRVVDVHRDSPLADFNPPFSKALEAARAHGQMRERTFLSGDWSRALWRLHAPVKRLLEIRWRDTRRVESESCQGQKSDTPSTADRGHGARAESAPYPGLDWTRDRRRPARARSEHDALLPAVRRPAPPRAGASGSP